MTHVELIERILEDYEKEFKEDLSRKPNIKAFRQGVLFAYTYLLTILKNGDAWMIYEKTEGERE